MPLVEIRGHRPQVAFDAFVAPDAQLIGQVVLGGLASVWYQVVLRADLNRISVGERSNIQDGTVMHVEDDSPCIVGREVVVGHRAVLHGCRVGDRALIGIGAILQTGSEVGEGALIGAGAMIPPGRRIRPGWLALGSPAREVRALEPAEMSGIVALAAKYCGVAAEFRRINGLDHPRGLSA